MAEPSEPSDTDLIARLYVSGRKVSVLHKALTEVACPHYVPPPPSSSAPRRPQVEQRQHDDRSRASTAEPEEWSYGAQGSRYGLPCLEFRFSRGPQTGDGFVFGRDPNCDIALPKITELSWHHFALTFDKHHRPIIRDLGSLVGTEVMYGTQGQGSRRRFDWIIGADETLKSRQETIAIKISGALQFTVVVSPCEVALQSYVDMVTMFHRGTLGADGLVRHLNIRSRPQTEAGSGIHTPGAGPIAVRDTVGQGAFGVVTRVWDASTADVYAVKEPCESAIAEGRILVEEWRKEARLHSSVSHNRIVTFLRSDFVPWPKLYFEYMPGGSLEKYQDLSVHECGQILGQCLDALTYLHGLDPPMVHRDIKPANILVESYRAGKFSVKFGDFGLSRQTADPTTLCGTYLYMAPEMHSEDARRYRFRDRHPYTPAVDIWSLGVVILELLPRGLPEGTYDGLVWCEKIVDKLNVDLAKAWDSMRQFLADYMVAMKPEDRYSAQQCFEFSAGFFDDGSRTPSQLDYTAHALTRYVEGEQTGFAGDSNFTGSRQPLSPGNNSAGSSDNNQSRQSRQTQKRHRSNAPSPSFPPPAPSSKRQSVQPPSWDHSSSTYTANHSRQGVEPRLSQISGLFDPLHELGGGSSLAALGSPHQERSAFEEPSFFHDSWLARSPRHQQYQQHQEPPVLEEPSQPCHASLPHSPPHHQHVDPPEYEEPYAFQRAFLPHSQQPLSFADGEPYAFHDTWVPRSPAHLGEPGPASSVYKWTQSLGGNIQLDDPGAYGPLGAQCGGVDSQGPLDVLQERTEEEWGDLEERLAAELHATLGRTASSEVS